MTSSVFGPPNLVRPDGVGLDDRIAARAANSSRVAVYPWDDGTKVAWFVTCSPRDVEQVFEELRAHVGVSFTDFRGELAQLDATVQADRWAKGLVGDGPVAAVSLLEPDAHRYVSRAFLRWLDLWEGRPETRRIPRRPTAELLTEYRLALGAGRRGEAEAALEALKASGALEIINVHYLELEFRDRFDGPAAVLDHPRLDAILQIRRPARVTDLVARAVDRTHLRPDDTTDVEIIRKRFVRLPTELCTLLTTPGECRSQSGALLVALHLDRQNRSPAVISGLPAGVALDDRTATVLAGLAARHAAPADGDPAPVDAVPVTASTPGTLAEYMALGDFDRVLDLAGSIAVSGTVDFALLDAAIRAAQWLDSIDAARRALAVLDAAPVEVSRRFTEGRLISALVDNLRSLVSTDRSTQVVAGWADLFEGLISEPSWSGALAAAEHGVLEWPVTQIAHDLDAVARLTRTFTDASETGAAMFPQLLPYLVEWLARADDANQLALLDLYEAVMTYLALNDRTRSGLALLGDMAGRLVSSGLSSDRYCYCLDTLDARWAAGPSPSGAEWMCETLEMLLDQPCPDPAARSQLASRLLTNPGLGFNRIGGSLQDLLRSVANEYDLVDILPPPSDATTDDDKTERSVQGLSVGLYSLTVGALQRAKAHLERRWPGLVVETNSDKRATEELAGLARRVDAVVVAWRSSKHPATDCIEANCGPGSPPIMAAGKGSASLIRAAEEFLVSAGY